MSTRFASLMTALTLVAPLAVLLSAQSTDQLAAKNVSIAQTNFKGRSAVQVVADPAAANATSFSNLKITAR